LTRRKLTLAALVLGATLVAPIHTPLATAAESTELVVFAAASLREVFQQLATSFEKQHQGVKVRLSFAGSQELRVQIEQGAKVDVFASADEKHMAALQKQSLAQTSSIFARNEPVVIVPANNPAKLAAFADLPKAERIVVGAPEVPIGAYTEIVLANAEKSLGKDFREKVTAHIRSRELNVRQVLTKVTLGEADAGIVYKTDALTAKDKVMTIAVPEKLAAVASYPIAALSSAAHPELAQAWITLVLSKDGQGILAAAGFKAGAASPAGKNAK
jgi:molybdate transport system substrate-binding protein